MKLFDLLKKVCGKTMEEPRRNRNWNFPIKEYVLANSVYTNSEEVASEPPALVWVSFDKEVSA